MASPGPEQGELWVQLPNYGGAGRLAPDFFPMFTTRTEDWAEARQATVVWVLRVTSLRDPEVRLDDGFLRDTFLPRLEAWGIRLAVNMTGATLAECNDFPRRIDDDGAEIERLLRLGARISSLSLQSPLSKVGGHDCAAYGRETGFDQRVADIVRYAKVMAGRFPSITIGLVDAMPAKGWSYADVYRDLVAALTDEGITLAFLHLDCPAESASPGWSNVLEVENFVRNEMHVPFGLIYVSKVGGETSNVAFRDAVLAEYRDYHAAGGRPDHCVLTSWYRYPGANLAETDEDSAPFMNLVRDFARVGGLSSSQRVGETR
ncbi:MAG: hypothetical protein U0031_22955, partial [Thermomicrobiales bacterium]